MIDIDEAHKISHKLAGKFWQAHQVCLGIAETTPHEKALSYLSFMMKEFCSPIHDIERRKLKSVIYDWLIRDDDYGLDEKRQAFEENLHSESMRHDLIDTIKPTLDLYLSFFDEKGDKHFNSLSYTKEKNSLVEHVFNSCGFVYALCPDDWSNLDVDPVQQTIAVYTKRRVEKTQAINETMLNKKDKAKQWKDMESLAGFIQEQPIYPLVSQKVVQNKLHALFCEGYKKMMVSCCEKADLLLRGENISTQKSAANDGSSRARSRLKHKFKG